MTVLVRLYGNRGDDLWSTDWRADGNPFWVVTGITIRGYEYKDGKRCPLDEPFITEQDGEIQLGA